MLVICGPFGYELLRSKVGSGEEEGDSEGVDIESLGWEFELVPLSEKVKVCVKFGGDKELGVALEDGFNFGLVFHGDALHLGVELGLK